MTNDESSDIARGIVLGLCKRSVTPLDQLIVLTLAVGTVLELIGQTANFTMPAEANEEEVHA